MALEFEQYFEALTIKRMWNGFGKYLVAGAVFLIVVAALFNNGAHPGIGGQHVTVASPGNCFYVDVLDVDPVIARQFRLPVVSGVLVNQVMSGMAGRLTDLKRGDVILKLNAVDIQSVSHFQYLMAQKQAGDKLVFDVIRNGKVASITVQTPQFVVPVDINAPPVRNAAVAVFVLALVFLALFFNFAHRTVIVILGAVLMLVLGALFGFYDQTKAFRSIYMEPILLLISMGIFPIFLEKAKFFDYSAKKVIVAMRGDAFRTVAALCVMTYVLSLLVNNLTTLLVMIPVTLYVARGLNIDPLPVAIAEIIASNIGGASTLIGDFPNMLIGASTGLSFMDFIFFMMPIGIILMLVLLWYLRQFEFTSVAAVRSAVLKNAYLDGVRRDLHTLKVDWKLARLTLWVLGAVLAAFIILPFWRVEAATIGLAGGFVMLAMRREDIGEVLKKISISDILFFLGLFIIVGGAQHAGLLKDISDTISTVSMGNGIIYLLLLMWSAALCTAFLNAGPAAAFFIPMLMNGPYSAFNDTVWWALSLGILAGSCATLAGATGGIVTQTLLEEDQHALKGHIKGAELTFHKFSQRGVPLSVIFLAISSIYIVILAMAQGIK